MASSISSSATTIDARVPLLASASGGGGGTAYSMWRPQMTTFLMRHGIETRDYSREIVEWKRLSAAAQASAEAEESAIAIVLGLLPKIIR